jgi:nucleoside-diphosphate kinase
MDAVFRNGFVVEQAKTMMLTAEQIRSFYAEHVDRPYFPGLYGSVAGPIFAMVLGCEGAVQLWRDVIGPSNPAGRTEGEHRHTLRAMIGHPTDTPDNGVHGSDSVQSAVREISMIRDWMIRDWWAP